MYNRLRHTERKKMRKIFDYFFQCCEPKINWIEIEVGHLYCWCCDETEQFLTHLTSQHFILNFGLEMRVSVKTVQVDAFFLPVINIYVIYCMPVCINIIGFIRNENTENDWHQKTNKKRGNHTNLGFTLNTFYFFK